MCIRDGMSAEVVSPEISRSCVCVFWKHSESVVIVNIFCLADATQGLLETTATLSNTCTLTFISGIQALNFFSDIEAKMN